jgi:type II secretory pathway pseudopilin PulG
VTLIEVMFAVIVLSVGLLAGAQLLAVSLQTHQLSRTTTDSARLASEKVEQLMKLDFALDPAIQISAVNPDPLNQNVAGYFDIPLPGFTRRWRVQAGPTANTRLVTVRLVPAPTDLRMARPVVLETIVRDW